MGNEIRTDVAKRCVTLPPWLDDFVFKELGARYAPKQSKDLDVLKWGREDIGVYLGTYFPRTFAESYSIFSKYFNEHNQKYIGKSEISVFDFGCGTGGELIGFILAVSECFQGVTIRIETLDGNGYALRCLEKILEKTRLQTGMNIAFNPISTTIDDFYDLDIADKVLGNYDFIITFKAIYEFVKNQQFDKKNPYEHFITTFLPKLNDGGILCMADLSTRSEVANDWIPKMMDKAERACKVNVLERNKDFNEVYKITHSLAKEDKSKITWRIYG